MGSKYFDLKRFREDKNISQVELSKATGISQSLISKIENRKMPLTDENAGIIDNIYGNITCYYIDDESFYQDSDNPKPNFDGIGIPYFNVDFITGYDVIMNDQTINPEFFINFPLYNNATCWVNASGKSMEPLITPGDIIAIRKLNDWQTYLLPGEVYAIVTTEYRTIKRVLEKDADTLILVPENPEYGRKEIPKNIVLEVYQVLGCMKKVI